ncbi:MAG: hypothetical protein ABIS86_22825 [Streptosporangiaceae bacterium]
MEPETEVINPTREDVLASVGPAAEALTVGDLGRRVALRHGRELPGDEETPIGQALAGAGLSLSALQKIVDGLVGDGELTELRGRDLWDWGLPTTGTKAQRRYYFDPQVAEESKATMPPKPPPAPRPQSARPRPARPNHRWGPPRAD